MNLNSSTRITKSDWLDLRVGGTSSKLTPVCCLVSVFSFHHKYKARERERQMRRWKLKREGDLKALRQCGWEGTQVAHGIDVLQLTVGLLGKAAQGRHDLQHGITHTVQFSVLNV
jgi:hypothetical protein